MNNYNNKLLPFGEDYFSLANPNDKYLINDRYTQLYPIMPMGNTYNQLNNNRLQALAQNLVGNNNYYNLQDMLRGIYGY